MPFSNLKTLLFASALIAAPGYAVGAEGGFTLELNDSTDVQGGCRLTFVAVNGLTSAVEKASYEVFTFGKDGRVGQSLVFQFGGFRAGKTKVFQFDLPAQPCSDISRLLLNDAIECVVDGSASQLCIDAIETKNITPIDFGY